VGVGTQAREDLGMRQRRFSVHAFCLKWGSSVADTAIPTPAGLPALTYVRLLHSEVTNLGAANFSKD